MDIKRNIKKFEIINSIAKEINQHYKIFRDQVVMNELKENGMLFDLFRDYKEKLFPRTDKQEFAAIYSQTVIFVLLGAALFNSNRLNKKGLNKILLNIIRQLTGIDTVILDILKSITTIDIPDKLITLILESKEKISDTVDSVTKEDDVLALLYQRFLKRYEPVMHKKIKYYYTPGPVVSFMVHTVHQLIKEKLSIDEGLADLDIHIMDPAFGSGNFLSAVIGLVIDERKKKYGEGMIMPFIKSYLPNNIHGYEVMLPIYLLGYINLQKTIKSFYRRGQGKKMRRQMTDDRRQMPVETTFNQKFLRGGQGGRFFQKESPLRNLYLNDALENKEQVGFVKNNTPIGVIICDPPYSKNPFLKYDSIHSLVIDYLKVEEHRINEKNVKGLNDMYVKFFRFGQWAIDQIGNGIMAFITSNSYLENPTFRGMRYSLLKSFDEIYIFDLHGAAMKGDKNAEDENDENIFGIGQGIAIGFFIKRKSADKIREVFERLYCNVYYYSLKGSKAFKLNNLEQLKQDGIKYFHWERLFPSKDFYLFTPGRQVELYQHFIKVTDIFPVHSVCIVTARDKLTIKPNEEEMYTTVSNFSKLDETFARKFFELGEDTRDWNVIDAQKDIIDSGVDRNKIVPILYRPFDLRFTYYTGKSRGFICMPRPGVMSHMLGENIGLITVRQVPGGSFNHCFVTDTIIESRITSSQKGIAYIFPLYTYIFDEEEVKQKNFKLLSSKISLPRHSNIDPGVFTRLNEIFGMDNQPSSSEIFYYVYAILHSGIYREKYRDHLKIDFPRIPFTSDFDLFMQLSGLGERLASVHLMKSPELVRTFSKYEVIGNDLVDKPHFKPEVGEDGRVYINKTQYFSNIPLELWEFKLCGYQVLKKWLLDRKKRVLTPGDIRHYIKICRALQLTVSYRKEIDVLYAQLEKSL